MSARDRFLSALSGEGVAFAPIVWAQLPALVHQERDAWWQDPSVGQRLIADAAALAGADAMFVFAAAETVRVAVTAGERGDAALDALASGEGALRGAELVRTLRAVAPHGVIAAIPAPAALARELSAEEPDAAEDAFTDFASSQLEAGADVIAVTGVQAVEVNAGMDRALRLAELFGRRVFALCGAEGAVKGWDEQGEPLGVISNDGEWPQHAAGVVITPGDVSGRWDAARLRAVGRSRPDGTHAP